MEWSEQTSSSILPASRFSRSVAIQRFRFGFVQGEQLAGQIPQVLASVKEIDNLNRAGEVLRGDVPDPFGSVADRHFLSRPAPAAIPGFQIEPLSELFSRFDGAGIGGRVRVADGVTFRVPFGLGKHASQLGFARGGRLSRFFAGSSLGLFFGSCPESVISVRRAAAAGRSSGRWLQ